jgi:sigma-B regulation protein RsbU (phosphoserine phosphatase)
MELRLDPATRETLVDRRERLRSIQASGPAAPEIADLLSRVDAALGRWEAGRYGLCEICGDPVEEDRLRADPLIRFCVDDMDAAERAALERDLGTAARVQRALLPPQDVGSAGWDVRWEWRPHGAVSGDYCDLVPSRGGAGDFLFAVGDVAGKGVAASILSSHLNALFRTLHDLQLPVGEMLFRANRVFCESTGESHYATLAVGRAAPDGAVEWCNAGQTPPLLVSEAGVEACRGSGLPLGLFCDVPYLPVSRRLRTGESLVLATDGVTEARDAAGEEFGSERLGRAAFLARAGSAREIARACLGAFDAHRGGIPAHDDVTLLVLKRAG